jgi:hypothetical protein
MGSEQPDQPPSTIETPETTRQTTDGAQAIESTPTVAPPTTTATTATATATATEPAATVPESTLTQAELLEGVDQTTHEQIEAEEVHLPTTLYHFSSTHESIQPDDDTDSALGDDKSVLLNTTVN